MQRSILALVAAFTVIFAAAILVGQVNAAADASEFLISFGKRASKELNDESLSKSEQETRFRELLNEAVDVPAICRFILGRHWPTATLQERKEFLLTFEDVAVQRFLPMLTQQTDEYQGKSFEIVDVQPAGSGKGQVFVRTLVVREQGAPVHVTWRIRERDNEFKIIDVSAEGVSMVLTLRQEYSSVIRQAGGVGALVDLMRKKLQSGAYAPKGENENQ